MSSRVGAQTLLRQTQRLLQQAAHAAGQGKVPDDGGGPVLKEVHTNPPPPVQSDKVVYLS